MFSHKNYSTGNYRVSAGFPCKNCRETLCILSGNPVIFTDCREISMIITCILQGSPATQGFPTLSMRKKFAVCYIGSCLFFLDNPPWSLKLIIGVPECTLQSKLPIFTQPNAFLIKNKNFWKYVERSRKLLIKYQRLYRLSARLAPSLAGTRHYIVE